MKKTKKVKTLILLFSLLIVSLFAFTACGGLEGIKKTIEEGGLTQLPAPTGVRLEEGNLCWNPVEYASKYTVSIDGKEYYCDENKYVLDKLTDGDHVFFVRANGDGAVYKTSDNSEKFTATTVDGSPSYTSYYGQFDELTKKES
ncbi:MAG: hypothetical protein IJ800_01925, partial [Clostridia bacterium]|nr:hypothetical protein [Clostridia bacterium]